MKKAYLVVPMYKGIEVEGYNFSVDIEFPTKKDAKNYGDKNFPDIYEIEEVVWNRKLLFIDIMGRIPYGTKFRFELDKNNFQTISFNEDPELPHLDELYSYWVRKGLILPYLRSLSTMTEEEKKAFEELSNMNVSGDDFDNCEPNSFCNGYIDKLNIINLVDWLNAHHFDYRRLIKMGLALEAPKDMY